MRSICRAALRRVLSRAPRNAVTLLAVLIAPGPGCAGREVPRSQGTLIVRPYLVDGAAFTTRLGAELLLGPEQPLSVQSSDLEETAAGWTLSITLEDAAGERLTELSEACLGHPLAIMAGDEVWTAPRVAEAIGARLAIPLTGVTSRRQAEAAQARLLGG